MKTSPQPNAAAFSCKLTSPELSRKKQTVVRGLKERVVESKEINAGFAYKFNVSNTVIDHLFEFIKSERECCGFFNFNLSISNESKAIWLELSGPKGVKEFIKTDLEF